MPPRRRGRRTSCGSSRASPARCRCTACCGCGSTTARWCPGCAGSTASSSPSPGRTRPGCPPRPRWPGRDFATHSEFTVSAGERVPFVLTWHPLLGAPAQAGRPVRRRWTTPRPAGPSWMAKSNYDGAWQGEVRRSLIVLKALTYHPTGGIVAAPTTSLPEQIGGPRNWDYRYCWLRDAALTLQALLGAGFIAEAGRWRDWLLRAVAGDPADLQIMYGLTGSRRTARAGAALAVRLRGLDAGPDRQRGGRAAAARRLGRDARRAGVRPGGRPVQQRRRLGAADQPAGVPGGPLARPGQRAVGDARRPRSTSCTRR